MSGEIQKPDDIKEATLEGIDGFFTKLTEAADIVTAKLVEVAPEAAEGLLNLVQFKSGFEIIVGLFWTLPLMLYLAFLLKPSIKHFKNNKHDMEEQFAVIIMPIIILSLPTIISFLYLLHFETWLGLFYPEGYIALKALEAVGISL